jgi:hypothetical protein
MATRTLAEFLGIDDRADRSRRTGDFVLLI